MKKKKVTDESKEDGFWNIGESLTYTYDPVINFEKDVFSDNIRFSIIDHLGKGTIMSGNLKI